MVCCSSFDSQSESIFCVCPYWDRGLVLLISLHIAIRNNFPVVLNAFILLGRHNQMWNLIPHNPIDSSFAYGCNIICIWTILLTINGHFNLLLIDRVIYLHLLTLGYRPANIAIWCDLFSTWKLLCRRNQRRVSSRRSMTVDECVRGNIRIRGVNLNSVE